MNLDVNPPTDMDRLRAETVACIPSFNERSHIADVVEGALDLVDLVVVVDDGSVDGTPKIAQQAGAMVVRHSYNLGYGRTLQSCFNIATELNPGALVILDGDGQHIPDDIPKVMTPVLEGEAHLCIGSRLLPSSEKSGIPLWRQLGIRFITLTTNALMNSQIPLADSQCGFRAYAPPAYKNLCLRADGMGASVEILWQCKRMRLRIKEVSVSCLYHIEGGRVGAIHQGFDVLRVNMLSAMNSLNGSAPDLYQQSMDIRLRRALRAVVRERQGEHRSAGGVPYEGRKSGRVGEGALAVLVNMDKRGQDSNHQQGEGVQNREHGESRSRSN